ncbi:dienelactone hydrolase family protein [Reyranella sp.]|uniref:dienelactone hydrolase family protein n=1 Tax=Reyranella sp. TaxID=1929291 RepID=UPI00378502BC
MANIRSLLLVFLVTFAIAPRVEAGEFVHFKSGNATLIGYLARPMGSGPFPAVVLLHGSGGFHASMLSWADRLSRWGYVALSVDSFSPRGRRGAGNVANEQAGDAFEALRYLTGLSQVRANAVALMGFSMGGMSTLADLEQGSSIARLYRDRFRAGIAFYPQCDGFSGLMSVPTLVLVGELDSWTTAAACIDMVAGKSVIGLERTPGIRPDVKLIIYPGARHGFDIADLGIIMGGVTVEGHRLEYNEAATRDAAQQVRSFLDSKLVD